MVGSLHPRPIATLPFLAPHLTVVAFCEGVLKYATAWEALRDDAEQEGMTLDQAIEWLGFVLSLTDVTRFLVPKSPEVVIFVGATHLQPNMSQVICNEGNGTLIMLVHWYSYKIFIYNVEMTYVSQLNPSPTNPNTVRK
ncbi:hypothetical protein Cni_G14001 [Canna indica]|uniref:Uncharacterized protein n=1 Tax=Canna indica TaxID=4628 RepID=A0AAQ3KAX4_9LILI|nr:hypothetical protein Cni_G14001 [Canna indica]